MTMAEASAMASLFRPPINRAMRALDRSAFHKKVPLAAARVLDKRNIARFRAELSRDLLKLDRVPVVHDDPLQGGMKALLLKPEINPDSKNI